MTHKSNNNRHPVKRSACAALGIFLCVTCGSVAAAEYYRWIDENGVVHMTDKRPEDIQVEVVKPRKPVPRTLQQQADDEAQAELEAAEAEAAAEEAPEAPITVDPNAPRDLRCQQEKERLGILQSNSVVHMQDANGNLKTLNEGEIQREIAVTQKAIDALCD